MPLDDRQARNLHFRILLSFFMLLLLVTPAQAQTVHTLTLQLDTTADWVKLELQGFAIQVVSRQLSAGSGLEVTSKGLALNKASWDATPVTLRAELRLTPTGEKPQLAITRGLLGQVRVQLLLGKRGLFDVTQKDETKLPNNLSVHPLELAKILASKPLPRHDFGQKLLAFITAGMAGRTVRPKSGAIGIRNIRRKLRHIRRLWANTIQKIQKLCKSRSGSPNRLALMALSCLGGTAIRTMKPF